MLTNYLAKEGASALANHSPIQQIHNLINQAVILNQEANQLDKELEETKLFSKMMIRHANQIKNASTPKEKEKLENQRPQAILSNQKRGVISKKQIELLLSKVQQWSLKGYKVIVQLRQTVTGQELIYHVQDANHAFSYTLNEEEFLKLLANNNAGMTRTSWAQIEKAISEGTPPLNLFQLNVGAKSGKYIEKQTGKKASIHLTKDALYQYLIHNDEGKAAILRGKDEGGGTDYSRIAELHSQLMARYDWIKNSSGGVAFPPKNSKSKSKYFMSQHRKKLIDAFIQQYKKEKLHRDTDKFYESGDATLNEYTLIESKVGNATVSIQTIRNAIKDIAALQGANKEKLKQQFIQMFTKEPDAGRYLTQMIQKGAYEKAVESINKLFQS